MTAFEVVTVNEQVIGLDTARALLHSMEAGLADMHHPLEGMIDDLHRQTDEQFATLGAVAGTPWEPLDPTTVRDKAQHGYPAPEWPLVATGELRESALGHGAYDYGQVGLHEATFGLEMDRDGWNIAALQQWGVPWREVTQHRHHKDGTEFTVTYMWHLPSRPMLVATEELLDEGADRIVAWVFNPLA